MKYLPGFRAALLVTACLPALASAAENRADAVAERVMVIGNADRAQDITGSAHYIGAEVLERNNYTDVNRILRQVPGVNLQEEEGYGNRPNIGFRGGRSERSADITLMEDGVLIAPAPYASPSAYYFPRMNKMEALEVRKGSSAIKFGPRTTSGALNLITRSVPSARTAGGLLGYGTDNTQRAHAYYGDSVKLGAGTLGFVIDAAHEATDGFKSIGRAGGDTGYSIQDVMGKVKYSTDASKDIFQSFELKIGATEEDSDETYLGLSQADFNANPYHRYAASQIDMMDAEHRQYQLRHFIDFGAFDATTTVYHNQFSRNWYKLQDLTVGGTQSGLGAALEDATFLNALRGDTDLDGGADNHLRLRANNRDYYATGVQSDMEARFNTGAASHNFGFGARYHYDKEDRFQKQDRYAISGGVMSLSAIGAPGSHANRHATADAVALYVLDEITLDKWTFVPGIRYENIDLKREDFNSNDVRENSVDAFMPGLGLGYEVNETVSLFGGVHKGFAPPSPGSTNDDPEESVNYELGARVNRGAFSAEIVGFFNDYSNLLGECTLSSGCTGGAVGDQFNAGEVDAYGAEISVSYDAAELVNLPEDIKLPVSANYTHTQAEFKNNFTSSFDEWGTVTSGDELPYIPEHQFYVSAGVVAPKWEAHVAGKFVDEMRTQAGSGAVPAGEGTDAHFVLDIAAEYEVHKNVRLFGTVDNVLDEEYVAARRPAGARPGKPFTALAGVKFAF